MAYSFQNNIQNNLGKTCLSYRGPFIRNKILRLKIKLDTSEAVFMKTLKHCKNWFANWLEYSIYFVILYFIDHVVKLKPKILMVYIVFHNLCK